MSSDQDRQKFYNRSCQKYPHMKTVKSFIIALVKNILILRPPDFACPMAEVCGVGVLPVLIQSNIHMLGDEDDDGDDDNMDSDYGGHLFKLVEGSS